MTYKEIAQLTGYHEKYILKLKKDILNKDIKLEHGNKNKEPINKINAKEEKYICELYKRSHASIRQFSRFYSKRSYYTHEDSDGLSNSEEGESNQDLKLLMAFEKNTNDSNDKFVDALDEKYFFE